MRRSVASKRYGDLELRSRAAGVRMCRSLPQELWSSEVVPQVEGHGGRDVWRSGDALQACRRGDVEVWSAGALAYCCCCCCWNF